MVKFLRLGKKQIGGISMLKKVAILANGGDVSGFNAVIRAIIKTAEHNNVECYGFIDGYNGLLKNNYVRLSTANDQSASGILPKGGSIIGSSTNANVFNYKVVGENGEVEYKDLSDVCVENIKKDGFDCIFTLGGDGTQKSATRCNACCAYLNSSYPLKIIVIGSIPARFASCSTSIPLFPGI